MNIVAINTANGNVFESQSYTEEMDKEVIKQGMQNDATGSGIEITISEMTDDELNAVIST
jgi:hypothetical protein